MFSSGWTSKPSAPRVVDTTGTPAAMASRILRRLPLPVSLAYHDVRVELAHCASLKLAHQSRSSSGVSSTQTARLPLTVSSHQFRFDVVPIANHEGFFARFPNDSQVGHQMNAFNLD